MLIYKYHLSSELRSIFTGIQAQLGRLEGQLRSQRHKLEVLEAKTVAHAILFFIDKVAQTSTTFGVEVDVAG